MNILAYLLLLFCPSCTGDITLQRLLACTVALILFNWKRLSLGLVQWLAVAWLVWAGVGCFLSQWSAMSIYGFHMRWEGLLTWVLMFLLAMAFRQQSHQGIGTAWIECISIVTLLAFIVLEAFRIHPWPVNSTAAIVTLSAVCLNAAVPFGFLLGLPLVLISGNRGALAALIVGTLYFELATRPKVMKWVGGGVLGLCLIVPFTPIGHKLALIHSETFGLGARSHWITEASQIVYERPLLGFGLDTQSNILTPASGIYEQIGAICDRVHFLPLEICIQTGFIGLILACLAFGGAIHYSKVNVDNKLCLSVVIAWIAFSCMNPAGVPATAFMLISLFLIKEEI